MPNAAVIFSKRNAVNEPLECRVCHHALPGLGPECHADIEKEWTAPEGRALVVRWTRQMGLWKYLETYGLDKLQK